MVAHHEHDEVRGESLIEKISGQIHDHDSSSSSDSDNDKGKSSSSPTSLKSMVFKLFDRGKPVKRGKPFEDGKLFGVTVTSIFGNHTLVFNERGQLRPQTPLKLKREMKYNHNLEVMEGASRKKQKRENWYDADGRLVGINCSDVGGASSWVLDANGHFRLNYK